MAMLKRYNVSGDAGTENASFEPDIKMDEIPQSDVKIPQENGTNAPNTKHTDQQQESDDEFDDSDDDDDIDYNAFEKVILKIQTAVGTFWKQNKRLIIRIIGVILALLYVVYFGFAMNCSFGKDAVDEGAWRLLVCTIIVLIILVLNVLAYVFRTQIRNAAERMSQFMETKRGRLVFKLIRWSLYAAMVIFMLVYLIVDVFIKNPRNIASLAGMIAFILLTYLTSVNPARVRWHPVLWGIFLQFVLALIILRTYWGREAFNYMGDRVQEFLAHADVGGQFVLRYSLFTQPNDFIFAFKVFPIIVFMGSATYVLYYLGAIQVIVKYFGRFLSFCIGTTAAESMNAAANIFLGMTESPLIIKNYIGDMTKSELHCVMTGGFATIAGSVLGAYILFGIPANHLISASIMSAPAALAVAKLSYPESNRRKAESKQNFNKMAKSNDGNFIEAAANGAMFTVMLCANIAVGLIAFISIVEFVNRSLTWFGDRVNIEQLTMQLILSYVLYPISLFMNVDLPDCRKIAELIGIKTIVNEFFAYDTLAAIIRNNAVFQNYTGTYGDQWEWTGTDIRLTALNQTLTHGVLFNERSVVIATYALCGFSNFGSMAITLGGMLVIAPQRKKFFSAYVFRAMVMGNVASCLTACVVGLLYEDPS